MRLNLLKKMEIILGYHRQKLYSATVRAIRCYLFWLCFKTLKKGYSLLSRIPSAMDYKSALITVFIKKQHSNSIKKIVAFEMLTEILKNVLTLFKHLLKL